MAASNDRARDPAAERLRALRADPPDPEAFAASLHRRLLAAAPPAPPPFWRRIPALLELQPLRPALVAAALLLLIGGLRLLRGGAPTGTEGAGALVAAALPATKVAVVRFNLSAEVAVERADIRVTLPEGLVFWSEGRELAQRSFEWKQALQAGDNDIPIAVRGLRPGRYRMTVSAAIGGERGERIDDEVLLEVTDG
jgi:hypothetical protein